MLIVCFKCRWHCMMQYTPSLPSIVRLDVKWCVGIFFLVQTWRCEMVYMALICVTDRGAKVSATNVKDNDHPCWSPSRQECLAEASEKGRNPIQMIWVHRALSWLVSPTSCLVFLPCLGQNKPISLLPVGRLTPFWIYPLCHSKAHSWAPTEDHYITMFAVTASSSQTGKDIWKEITLQDDIALSLSFDLLHTKHFGQKIRK